MTKTKTKNKSIEQILLDLQWEHGRTWQDVKSVLRQTNLKTFKYVQDTEDNMDGWEGKEEVFFEVFFDMAHWITTNYDKPIDEEPQ